MNPGSLPHDVYGLVPYEPPFWAYLAAALVGLLAAGLIFYLWRRFRRTSEQPQAAIDPLKVCLEKIRKIEPKAPFNRKNQVHFYHELSLLFREYLERVYDFPATDLTTEELKKRLGSHSRLVEQDTNGFTQFLEEADMIKFADQEVSSAAAEKAHASVMNWVDKMEQHRLVWQQQNISALKAKGEVAREI